MRLPLLSFHSTRPLRLWPGDEPNRSHPLPLITPDMPKLLSYLPLIATFLIISCAEKTAPLPAQTVAHVNGVPITKEELVIRLELTILPEFHELKGRNNQVLDILIDELVVSEWAENEGLTASPDYQEALDFVKQQALIRELFFEVFRKSAEPDSENIQLAVLKSTRQLSIQTLYTENHAISEMWRQSIHAGKTFTDLVNESTDNPFIHVNNSSFHWGDGTVPISIENIAYQLELGESSDLLELNNVYLIFAVRSMEQDVIITEYEYSLKWQRIKQVLQARTELRLANEYVDRYLTPLGITQRATGFLEISRYIEARLGIISEDTLPHPPLPGNEINIRKNYNLELPVVETPDYTWTGRDVLSILRKYNFRINSKSSKTLRATLTRFLKAAVRDQYLAERAKQLGLESKQRVESNVQMWARYFLYQQGVKTFAERDTTLTLPAMIADKITELRSAAHITINQELLDSIESTGIPMVAFWNGDITRQLAVPPLAEFR